MENFHFQDESDILSEEQINFMSDVLNEQGFKDSKVSIATLGKVGDNYGSNVKIITAERKDGTTMKMVAKVAPTSEFLRKAVNIEIVFGNEFIMYNKVLPKFRQLEIEADIPEKDRLKFPICYGTFEEVPHEMILLEDLRESDYVMKDKLKPLSDKDIRLILNSFAKLHSLSFVLKEKDLATYKDFTSKLVDFFCSPHMEANVINTFGMVEENICSLFDDDKYKNKLRGCLTNITNEAHKLRRCDVGSKYSVIIHGDSWTNNVMFKVNSTDGNTEECMPIDFQLSTERCPVSDFMYVIFSCTDFETRSQHYNDWIDEYHNKLQSYLSYYGIKVDYVYSKEKMLADLKRYAKFFLGWSIMIANVLCMDREDAAKFKNAMDSSDNVGDIIDTMKGESANNETQVLLKAKAEGIIDSYYDFGYCS